jgi:hypothetical protein
MVERVHRQASDEEGVKEWSENDRRCVVGVNKTQSNMGMKK